MTDKETEQVKALYEIYENKCFVCSDPVKQRAHILGDNLLMQKMYGRRIIDNPLDWLPACGLYHNSLIDIGKNKILASKIVAIIDSLIDDDDKRAEIEKIVNINIARKRQKVD